METLLDKLKQAFAHQAIVEGLPIKAEHTDRLAEIANRISKEHYETQEPVNPSPEV